MKNSVIARIAIPVAVVILIAVSAGGCAQPLQQSAKDVALWTPPDQMTGMYNQALDAFLREDYAESARIFNEVYTQSSTTQTGRRALYGLACALMMMAETAEDYREALSQWNNWLQAASGEGQDRELLLIAPIIRDKMIFSEIVASMENPDHNEHGPSIPLWLYNYAGEKLHRQKAQWATTDKALRDQRKRNKALEKENAALKEQNTAFETQNKDLELQNRESESRSKNMEFQIQDLESQIKAFEIIDQNIQKKKSAIPAAN